MRLLTCKGYLVEEQGMTYLAETDPDAALAPLQAAGLHLPHCARALGGSEGADVTNRLQPVYGSLKIIAAPSTGSGQASKRGRYQRSSTEYQATRRLTECAFDYDVVGDPSMTLASKEAPFV